MLGLCTPPREVDFSTSTLFRDDMFDTIDCSSSHRVIVDCGAVDFMDSSAYHALVAATEYAAHRGRVLIVSHLRPAQERVLRICDERDAELRLEA